MVGGERQLGHEEVVRDPLEVGEGLAGAPPGLSTVVRLGVEKPAMGRGPVVAGGAGVVGDGLRIKVELVEAVAGAVRGWRRWCTWRRSWRLRQRGYGGGGMGRRPMAPA
jgi:hypothetical protein